MKVLILTYYWPPSGGSGVQRCLKFVKYLQDFGITPVVYTVQDPSYPIIDASLEEEIPENITVLRQPIWEPYKLAAFFSKKKKIQSEAGFLNSKQSFFGKLSSYIRANYFIPDARMFWIQPSVKYLSNYLKEHSIDAVVSSGPPHSMHMIAKGLQKNTGIKWIADFRDPWTDIDYFHQLPLTKKAKTKHQKLEEKVLKSADSVVVVGKTMQENYLPFNAKTYVIPNGYDSDIVENTETLDSKFTITHIGLMNEDRNPYMLWEVLSELKAELDGFETDLSIQLIGKVDPIVIQNMKRLHLQNNLNLFDYLQHYKVQEFQRKTQVLLLAVNKVPSAKGIITGKIFEYLVSKRPILAIGPEDGDLSEILNDTHSGYIFDFDNKTALKEVVKKMYKDFKNQSLTVASENIEQYHRKAATEKLAELLKAI